jgi:hypothetical protein
LVHGVERVDGSMDPIEGRFVFHGHLSADGAIVAGTLSEEQVNAGVANIWADFQKGAAARAQLYHGPLVLRFQVSASGQVETCDVLLDRVTGIDATDVIWPALSEALIAKISAHRFVGTEGSTVVIQPFLFGESLSRP